MNLKCVPDRQQISCCVNCVLILDKTKLFGTFCYKKRLKATYYPL